MATFTAQSLAPDSKSEKSAVRDTQKLQRAIVDGLEDVKAIDIQIFNTEHLSPLFERVIVASGTSNRQTKALAASVRDAVREAGFDKPRTEGEENGEWIIVDCGRAVVHVMQPAIRQYYHLEELWGDKPVRLKGPTPKNFGEKTSKTGAEKARAATKNVAKTIDKKPAKNAAEGSGKFVLKSLAKSSAAKSAHRAAERAAKPAGSRPLRKAACAQPAKRQLPLEPARRPSGQAQPVQKRRRPRP